MSMRLPTRRSLFQSTSPVRGTTQYAIDNAPDGMISIHVPREGDDKLLDGDNRLDLDFNPRPP